jgi:hypothetical protein
LYIYFDVGCVYLSTSFQNPAEAFKRVVDSETSAEIDTSNMKKQWQSCIFLHEAKIAHLNFMEK